MILERWDKTVNFIWKELPVMTVNRFKYLGHIISNDLSDDADYSINNKAALCYDKHATAAFILLFC